MATKKTESAEKLDNVRNSIRDLFNSMDALDDPKYVDAAYDYLASTMRNLGYICIPEDELDVDKKGFNIPLLLDATGNTKKPRLDEIQNRGMHLRQGVDPIKGNNTALELSETLITRAGMPDGPRKEDLISIIARALRLFIPNPDVWQNEHAND